MSPTTQLDQIDRLESQIQQIAESYILIRRDGAEHKLLLDMLGFSSDVYRDMFWSRDPESRESLERIVGLPFDTVLTILDGINVQFNTKPVQRSILSEMVQSAIDKAAVSRINVHVNLDATNRLLAELPSVPGEGAHAGGEHEPPVISPSAPATALELTSEVVEAQRDILRELNDRIDHGETLTPEQRILIQRKICSRCSTVKDFDQFGKNAKNKDAKQAWCKNCISGYDKDGKATSSQPASLTPPPLVIEEEPEHDLDDLNHRLTAGEKLGPDEHIAIQRKTCGRCSTPKPFDQFSDSGINGDGKQDWCKKCQNDYDKERKRQKAAKPEPGIVAEPEPERDASQIASKIRDQTEPEPVPVKTAKPDKDPEFVWSQKVRCVKCGSGMVRYRRHRDADKNGNWLHLRVGFPPCVMKIGHYQVKDDKHYNPDLDPGAPQAWKTQAATA